MEINIQAYESLQDFNKAEYYNIIVETLSSILDDSNNYQKLYDSIYKLRILNKFQRKAFIMVFDVVYIRLGKILRSENDNLVNIVLQLLLEIFSENWCYNEITEWVSYLLPLIVMISANNNANSSLAMDILNRSANNMFYSETVTALLDGSKCNADNAFITLQYLIHNSEQNILMNLDWDIIFDKVNDLFSTHYELACRFCEMMTQKFNKEDLFYILAMVNEDITPMILDLMGFKHKERVEFSKFINQYN
jgi:hypothetical protein